MQVLWKKLLVCLSAVGVKTLINFLINVLLKKCNIFGFFVSCICLDVLLACLDIILLIFDLRGRFIWFCCLGGERLPHQELHHSPNPYKQWVGSLTPHRIYICKGCEMGPVVYPPYPRRLESLTVCRCLYKGSTFFSII